MHPFEAEDIGKEGDGVLTQTEFSVAFRAQRFGRSVEAGLHLLLAARYAPGRAGITDDQLREKFGAHGRIEDVYIKVKDDGFTFGFVSYSNQDEAQDAVRT